MTGERITADTPLFMIDIADPKELRFCYVAFRIDASPYDYDWGSLLVEWDGRDNTEEWERWWQLYKQDNQECFADEKEAREAEWRKFAPSNTPAPSDQQYEQDFLERQCFTAEEAEVIEAHVGMLGCQAERKPVALPLQENYAASDSCGNAWQYRELWEEGAVPCRLRYVGYFGENTQRVPGLLPDDYFDCSYKISSRAGEVEVKRQPSLWETEEP